MATSLSSYISYQLKQLPLRAASRSPPWLHTTYCAKTIHGVEHGCCSLTTRREVHLFTVKRRGRTNRAIEMDHSQITSLLPDPFTLSDISSSEWSMILTVALMILPLFLKTEVTPSSLKKVIQEIAKKDNGVLVSVEKLPGGSLIRSVIQFIADLITDEPPPPKVITEEENNTNGVISDEMKTISQEEQQKLDLNEAIKLSMEELERSNAESLQAAILESFNMTKKRSIEIFDDIFSDGDNS